MNISKKEALPFLRCSFPEYAGRKFKMEFVESVWFHNTNWSGGSKNEYAAIGSNGSSVLNAPHPFRNTVENTELKMRPDVCIVKHAFCCGQDCGITIYLHISLAPRYIPA